MLDGKVEAKVLRVLEAGERLEAEVCEARVGKEEKEQRELVVEVA